MATSGKSSGVCTVCNEAIAESEAAIGKDEANNCYTCDKMDHIACFLCESCSEWVTGYRNCKPCYEKRPCRGLCQNGFNCEDCKKAIVCNLCYNSIQGV